VSGDDSDEDHRTIELTLLGVRDPATVQARTPDAVEDALASAGDRVRRRPAAGEWSASEILGHLLYTELVYAGRYRWILAQDRPVAIGYDPDAWVAALHHRDDDLGSALTLFRALREFNLRLWATTSVAERQRVACHEQRGDETLETSFRMVAGHDLRHLDQLHRTLERR
jgi:DinB superfamily